MSMLNDGNTAVDLSFGDVVPNEFAPIPDDTYHVKIEKAELTKTKKEPVRTMVKIQLKVTEGPFENRVIFDQWVIQPETMWKVQQNLEALTGKEWRADSMKLDVADLPGYAARAIIYTQAPDDPQYDPQNRVKRYLPADSSGAAATAGAFSL